MASVFVSHTKDDKDLLVWFDQAFAREQVNAIRFELEFEAQKQDPIHELHSRLKNSNALFVLLSPRLLSRSTLHTSNWVSAETGMARALGKPIWVFERWDSPIGFPVPFVNHFVRLPPGEPSEQPLYFQLVRDIIKSYSISAPREPWSRAGLLRCSNLSCQTSFQIHQNNFDIGRCPACCSESHWEMAARICVECNGKGKSGPLLFQTSCKSCDGIGYLQADMSSSVCANCKGAGTRVRRANRSTPHSANTIRVVCETCQGTGYERWAPFTQ